VEKYEAGLKKFYELKIHEIEKRVEAYKREIEDIKNADFGDEDLPVLERKVEQ
jgi:hypothetical protein